MRLTPHHSIPSVVLPLGLGPLPLTRRRGHLALDAVLFPHVVAVSIPLLQPAVAASIKDLGNRRTRTEVDASPASTGRRLSNGRVELHGGETHLSVFPLFATPQWRLSGGWCCDSTSLSTTGLSSLDGCSVVLSDVGFVGERT